MIKETVLTPSVEKNEEQQIIEIKKELFDRECPQEYESLIAGVHLIEIKEPYAENLRSRLEKKKIAGLIRNKFKDEKVLDLGCGRTSDMWSLTKDFGANLYIGVDLNPSVGLPDAKIKIDSKNPWLKREFSSLSDIVAEDVAEENEKEYEPTKITEPKYKITNSFSTTKALEITDDMLRAISRFKDNSIGAIIISGIESLDLNSEIGKVNDEYLKTLQTEIKRVLKPGGILINNFSDISGEGLAGIARGASDNLHIFEKSNKK